MLREFLEDQSTCRGGAIVVVGVYIYYIGQECMSL